MVQQERKTQWLVLRRGEAYEKTLSRYESVFLFREAGGWCAWYARWHPKLYGEKPAKEFDVVTGTDFETAVREANKFIERRLKRDG